MTEHALGVISPGLMKAIHVELPHKAIDLIMPEVSRQDDLLKLVDILYDKFTARRGPVCYLIELFILWLFWGVP